MAKITHSDMRRGQEMPTQTGTTNQNYVVEDLSETQPSVDEQLAAFEGPQEKVVVSAPKISTEDKKKLESLIFMGRFTKEVEIAGHKFEMSTLTHRENNEIVSSLVKLGDMANVFNVRILTLAHSIKSIDGVSLDSFGQDVAGVSALERRMSVIDQMQLALVERLYTAFEALVKEADETVYGEKVKN